MACVTYKEHQMYPLSETPKVFVLRTQQLERLDVRMYAFMLDADPTLWEQFETSKLGNICHTFLGATPKDASADESSGVAFLKTKNVYTDFLDLSDVDYITGQAHKTRKSSALKNGDVLMTIIGASFEVIGRCLVYRGQPEPANINQNVIGIRVKEGIDLDPDFLCLQLNTQYGQMQVGQKAQRTAQFSLNKGLVEDFDVILPHIDEQKKILNRFSQIRNGRDGALAISEEMAVKIKRRSGFEINRTFAEEMGIDNFPEHKKEKLFLRNASATERLDIPASHPDHTRLVDLIASLEQTGPLSELVTVSEDSFNPKECKETDVNYIAIGDIDGISGIVKAPQRLAITDLPAAAKKIVHQGNILVSSVRAGTEKSVVFVATEENEGWICTTGFHVFKPRPNVDPVYIGILLKAPFALFQQDSLQNRATYPTLSEDNLLSILVPTTNDAKRKGVIGRLARLLASDREIIAKIQRTTDAVNSAFGSAFRNIFELVDDAKFHEIKAKADEAQKRIMEKEALQ